MPVEEAQQAVLCSLKSRNVINHTITNSHLEKRHFVITTKGFDRAMFHAATSEAKWILETLPSNFHLLGKPKKSELGANKDMLDLQNIRNIERKRERGVKYYNKYEYEYEGKTWIIGMEVAKDGKGWTEEPYYIVQKKGK